MSRKFSEIWGCVVSEIYWRTDRQTYGPKDTLIAILCSPVGGGGVGWSNNQIPLDGPHRTRPDKVRGLCRRPAQTQQTQLTLTEPRVDRYIDKLIYIAPIHSKESLRASVAK